MTLAEGVQDAILAAAAVTFIAGALNRWAVANHKDRLASFTSGAGNAAGRILTTLSAVPPGVDAAGLKAELVRQAAKDLMQEFDKTGPKISATEAKAAEIIEGQLGQIPGAAAVLPAAAAVLEGVRP